MDEFVRSIMTYGLTGSLDFWRSAEFSSVGAISARLSSLTAPGRRISICLIFIDPNNGRFQAHRGWTRIQNQGIRPSNSSKTCSARVGLTRPKRFALGAARGFPKALRTSHENGVATAFESPPAQVRPSPGQAPDRIWEIGSSAAPAKTVPSTDFHHRSHPFGRASKLGQPLFVLDVNDQRIK